MKETNVVSSPTFASLKFYIPTSLFTYIFAIPPAIGPNATTFDLARFDGVEVNTLPGVLHESVEQDKGKELTFGVFKSLPLVDAKDMEVSPLHMIFD
jgi:hypothetical protein